MSVGAASVLRASRVCLVLTYAAWRRTGIRKVFDKFVSFVCRISRGSLVGEAILLPRGVSNFFEFAEGFSRLHAGPARDHLSSFKVSKNINFDFRIAFIIAVTVSR